IRSAAPPACSISSLARSSSGCVRDSKPTRYPPLAKPSASRFPIPRPAPVIKTLCSLTTAKSILHFHVKYARIDMSRTLHLDKDTIPAGLRESVRKYDLRRRSILCHHVTGVRIIGLSQLQGRHRDRAGRVDVGEDAAIVAKERGMSRHSH